MSETGFGIDPLVSFGYFSNIILILQYFKAATILKCQSSVPGALPAAQYLLSNVTVVFEGAYPTYETHGINKAISAFQASSKYNREDLACIVRSLPSTYSDTEVTFSSEVSDLWLGTSSLQDCQSTTTLASGPDSWDSLPMSQHDSINNTILYAKDIKTALLAADIVVNKWGFQDYRLEVYGSLDKTNSYTAHGQEIIATKALRHQVSFRGEADPHDVLERARVLLNSRVSEGLPLTLGEAALTGAPIVCTDVRASRRVLTNPPDGSCFSAIVAPDDALAMARALDSNSRPSGGVRSLLRSESQHRRNSRFFLPCYADLARHCAYYQENVE
ncbi:hypothetical protein B0J14DRAFT_656870 [Halenospora varia]|nr:hypothetical protein B0J14DRAFT_656870 [Halenospora varia]